MIDTPLLTNTEIDIIGEVLNISMGAAATAVSVILNRQVSITTPFVQAIKKDEFEYKNLEPVVGVKINYIEGLDGSNFMIMNIADVKAIVSSLLGEETIDDTVELDEIHTSALGEIMNQMMGSSSTALSTFLHKSLNISPPSIIKPAEFLEDLFSKDKNENIVSVSFKFIVEGLVDNEFITVFPLDFTKEIINNVVNTNNSSNDNNRSETSEDYSVVVTGHKQIPEIKINSGNLSYKQKASHQSQKPSVKNASSESDLNKKRNISVRNLELENFDDDDDEKITHDSSNLGLLMDVALNITVEIGSVKKTVKDVVNLSKGSIIELDKRAGDPVDIIVNGHLFARGDVVVIEDNFGVRITEVINNK
jgi:flagellar motor switch protein FliN